MKQILFNKLWLRVGMIVAIMTTALSGTVWAATGTLVSNLSGITEGTYYIAALNSSNYYTVPNTTISGQTFTCTQGTFSNNTLTPATGAGEFVFTAVSGVSNAYYIYNTNLNKYLVATGSKVFGYVDNTSDDYGYWTFSEVTSGGFSGVFSVKHSNKTHYMRAYNNSVRCYDGANNNGVYLFKKVESASTVVTPTFSPAEGTYTSAQNVTISTTTTGATIYYTTDGNEPTTSSSVYSSAIPVSSTTTIKAMAVKAGMDNSSVATATYTIVSLDHAGTEADPYTVADARALLTAAPTTTFENVYVSGIISQVDSYNSTYKSITYWISDDGTTTDQFEVYSGKGLNGADFSSKDDLIVGSEVIVNGNIKKYNSTFEFDINSQIVSLTVPTYPIINAAATLNLAYNATSGEITYTIDNPTDATLTATTSADWISNIVVSSDKVTFTATANEGNANRTATITLSYTGAQNKTVTVTQGHYVIDYVTLPFEWNGSTTSTSEDLLNNNGITADGLGSDYATSNAPYRIKFDNTGDYIQIKTSSMPGRVYIDVKMIGGASTSYITIKESSDGKNFTDVEKLSIKGIQNAILNLESTKDFAAATQYIQLYFTKGSNVGVGRICVTNTIPVTVTSKGYATFCSDKALDFSNTNIKAYTGTREGDALTFSEVTKVPANTGLLLVCDGGTTANVPVVESAPAIAGNCLTGVTEKKTLNANDYILNVVDGGAGFYKAGEFTELAANRAYIPAAVGGNIKSFGINLTTGIDLPATEKAEKVIFDLSGRRVEKPAKGLYIVNGKKVLF